MVASSPSLSIYKPDSRGRTYCCVRCGTPKKSSNAKCTNCFNEPKHVSPEVAEVADIEQSLVGADGMKSAVQPEGSVCIDRVIEQLKQGVLPEGWSQQTKPQDTEGQESEMTGQLWIDDKGNKYQSLIAVEQALRNSDELATKVEHVSEKAVPVPKVEDPFTTWLDGVCTAREDAAAIKSCVLAVCDTMSTEENMLFQMSCDAVPSGELMDAVRNLSKERRQQQRKQQQESKEMKLLNCWPGSQQAENRVVDKRPIEDPASPPAESKKQNTTQDVAHIAGALQTRSLVLL